MKSVFPPPTYTMSADKILRSICCAEGGSFTRNKTSALHSKKLPKYSEKCFQYLSESELAVGTKRIFGCFLLERRMISRSISAVPRVLISPPPIATIALAICSEVGQTIGFCRLSRVTSSADKEPASPSPCHALPPRRCPRERQHHPRGE